MENFVYQEYKGTIHDVNRSGVGAVMGSKGLKYVLVEPGIQVETGDLLIEFE